jgi:hypothetical protein
VFENRDLRRIFVLKRDKITGKRRNLHKEELHNLYASPNIIRQIISRRLRWRGMWHAWQCTRFWWENPKEVDY